MGKALDGIPVKSKISADSRFKISAMKAVIKPTRPHRHADYHELIFLDEGAGFHEIDDSRYDVNPPVVFYLRPGQTHCWNFSALPKGYVLLFREELLLKEDIDFLYGLAACTSVPEEARLFPLLAELYGEFQAGGMADTVAGAFLHLLVIKLKTVAGTKVGGAGLADGLFQQYKRLVNEHFQESRQLKFYASRLNTTVGTLHAACKKSTGKTAASIINERVLLEAKMLLSATALPVKQIAADLQFSDSPHFAHFFKQHTNLTPRKYRDMALSKQ